MISLMPVVKAKIQKVTKPAKHSNIKKTSSSKKNFVAFLREMFCDNADKESGFVAVCD